MGVELKTMSVVAVVLVLFVVGYGVWAFPVGSRSVTPYADEVSAARDLQARDERFREKCASVGFTADQCVFFLRGADAP